MVDPPEARFPSAVHVTEVRSFFEPDGRIDYFLVGERLLADLVDDCDVPEGLRRVTVDGQEIDPEMWPRTMCEPGDHVVIRAHVAGDDQQGVKIAQVLLAIVGTIAAIYQAPGLAIGAALISAGLSFAFPPPTPSLTPTDFGPESDAFQITGARNTLRQWAPIPVVIGDEFRVWPQLAAKPFTEIEGGEQWLRLLFEVHHGRSELPQAEFRIGQNPLTNYVHEVEIRPGYDTDPPLELFADHVDEQQIAIKLNADDHGIGAWHSFTTTPWAKEASVDLTFPFGLGAFSSYRLVSYTIRVNTQYRLAGTGGVWSDFSPEDSSLGPGVVTSGSPLWRTSIQANQRGLVQRGLRFKFPTDTVLGWEFRIRIIEEVVGPGATGTVANWMTECQVTRFRSLAPSAVIQDVPNVATIALRIKATDQLSGVVDTFNCIVKPHVATWDGVSGWSDKLGTPFWYNTGLAAWHYANLLRGAATKTIVDDNRLETGKLNAWASFADSENLYVSGVIATQHQKRYWLEQIAATSRAVPSVINGKYGVIVDMPNATPVQLFTDRNYSNLQGDMKFIQQPHALRVRFVSPDSGWQVDQLPVYADGYSKDGSDPGTVAATLIHDLDMWGIADPDLAYRHGRYHLAASALRRRTITIDVDFEHLIANRGDRVELQSRSTLFGVSAARAKSYTDNGATADIVCDTDLTHEMDAVGVTEYKATVRKPDGIVQTFELDSWDRATGTLTLDLVATPVSGVPPAAGDLVSIGEIVYTTASMIITGIANQGDFRAQLTLMDYNTAIYDADQGAIPPWDPGVTSPVHHEVELPVPPVIISVVSDESVIFYDKAGRLVPRIVIGYRLNQGTTVPDVIEAQYRLVDEVNTATNSVWLRAPDVSPEAGQASIQPIEDGALYDLRIRSATNDGRASDWQLIEQHRAIGRTTPPPDPSDLLITTSDLLMWDQVEDDPPDMSGYRVKYKIGAVQEWDTALDAHGGLITQREVPLSVLGIQAGISVTIMVKSVDVIGTESVNFAWITTTLVDYAENVVNTKSWAPTWSGTKTNCSVSGGNLVADPDSTGFWTGSPGDNFWQRHTPLFWTDSYRAMNYMAGYITPAAGTLRFDLSAIGDYVLTYSYDGSPEARWPGSLEIAAVKLFIARLSIPAGHVQGDIDIWDFTIDVPDREESHLANLSTNPGAPGDRVAPTVAFTAIIRCEVTLRAQAAPIPAAQAVGFIVHDLNPVTGPLVELLDAAGATAPAGTTYDLRYVGY